METKCIPLSEINIIAPLWQNLNTQHLACSNNFSDHFARHTFESRCEKFLMLPEDCFHAEVVFDASGRPAGYCISTVQNEDGEIDSLYVSPQFRKQNLGSLLIASSLKWLESKNCRHITVAVAEGNESVFPFYELFGFAVRKTVLQLK